MTGERLTDRQLNRATLSRQLLLTRHDIGLVEATEFLLGLQAQVTEGPYQGLWSRLEGFTHEALTELIVDRQLARATTMRGTLHLHSLPDLVGIRELIQPVLERMWQGNFGKRFGDNDQDEVLKAAIDVIDREPMTAGSVGKALKDKFPTAEPLAMTVLLQIREIMVQVPPTRIWGSGHSPLLARAAKWLPSTESRLDRETLVRRYLRAYGPASVNDMQSWCGLTKLGEVFETLRPELVTFTAEDGRELFDLPDAPRPAADTPAPVRFLPLYDNVYLGYDNRRRMLAKDDTKRVNLLAEYRAAVLVDGIIASGWMISTKKGSAVLEIEPYRQLRKTDVTDLEREGLNFLRFMAETAESFDVRVTEVQA